MDIRRELQQRKKMYLIMMYVVMIVPIVIGIALCSHCALLLLGYDFMTIRVLTQMPISLFIILYVGSFLYKLCRLHRLYILYCFAMNACIIAQRIDLFDRLGIDLNLARMVMLIIGCVLLTLLIVKLIYDEKNEKEKEKFARKSLR